MDWLGDLPGEIWVALITGGLVFGQNFLNNRREDRRIMAEATERQAERDRADEQAAQERRAQLEDHWREKRLDAATRFLSTAEETIFGAVHIRVMTSLATLPESELSDGDIDTENERFQQDSSDFRVAFQEVLLVGGAESRRCASKLFRHVQKSIDDNRWKPMTDYGALPDEPGESAPAGRDQPEDDVPKTQMVRDVQRFHRLTSTYRRAVRAEVGTAD